MSSERSIKIALVQTCPLSAKEAHYPGPNEDPFEVLHQNLADTAKYVKQAKEKGADVVCFAEYYLQGILNEGRQVSRLYASILLSKLIQYSTCRLRHVISKMQLQISPERTRLQLLEL